jgi:uncharacterized protein involved in exopolysaccharide biosynthesis
MNHVTASYAWNMLTLAVVGAGLLFTFWGIALAIFRFFRDRRNKRRGYGPLF